VNYFSSSDSSKESPAISKSAACSKISISRTNLYYQPKLPSKDLLLKQQIEAVLSEHKAYGYRRIAIALNVNHKRVRRVMKLFNIKTKKLRKKPRARIGANKFPVNSAKNLFAEMVINQPNQAWVSDFTYLPYQNKFMYLATILDAFTREVIAWNISVRHNGALVADALIAALNKRSVTPEIFHSDQGSEYRSNQLTETLRSRNIKASMSKKSSPWQNGKQESFYQKFKFELEDFNSYSSQGELIEAIALQIHYYNHKRIHSALKMPPTIFYQRFKAAENSRNPTNSTVKPEENFKKNRSPLHLSYA
jgi:transposase InsO family protein